MSINTKTRVFAVALSVILLLCGCNTKPKKYKRISFESETLGEMMSHVGKDTIVANEAKESFASQMPIYEIKERSISNKECKKMMETLGLPDNPYRMEHEGNRISINLARYTDSSRGYFEMTKEELEKLAWDTFNKIPFMEGEYEYVGFRGEQTLSDSEGEHIERVLVSFYPILEGVRVIGDYQCDLWFDGCGLVEINIRLFKYEEIGTMDLVSLAEAEGKIKTPDKIYFESASGLTDTLKVDRVKLFLVNQYSRGCTILQPMYTFYGTAHLENGKQTDFRSSVIAIPESMTYE